jgi:hypothetical protein
MMMTDFHDAEAMNELAWGEADNRAEYVAQYEAAEMRKIREAEAMNEIEREWEDRHRPAPTAEEIHQQWHAVNGWEVVCPVDCGAADRLSQAWDDETSEAPQSMGMGNSVTERQIALINQLKTERSIDHWADRIEADRRLWHGRALTKERASETIDFLIGLPKPKPVERKLGPEGVHKLGDEIFKVVTSEQGYRYAKRLVISQSCPGHLDPTDPSAFDAPMRYCDGSEHEATASWKKASGMVWKLSEETLLTEAEAAQFGQRFGVCAVCGRVLSNPESIALGIGPICRSRLS